jgi:DNA-binding beta-propeller fold protein YncE
MEVNPETGVALSDVSVTGGGETNHLSDLAIDPTTGEVWASRGNNFPGRLVEIDPATGAVITILDLEEPLPRVTAIAFDSDGQLFASFDGNQLARVDLRTGSWSPIGTGFGGPKIAGLGFER